MAKTCGFCGSPGATKEHVWPDWLRKVILEVRASAGQRMFTFETQTGGKTKTGKNPDLSVTARMPCSGCNNTWMSGLENAVKPFMTDMVRFGEKVALSPERQLWLARWAVKTAMVYEYALDPLGEKYFSAEERLAFKERFGGP